jgi:DNA-binding transcriptional regulator YiaG
MGTDALPFCYQHLRASKKPNPAYPKALLALGDRLRKHRLDLGLHQNEVATRLGVTESSIWNWENQRSKPAARFQERIEEFLLTAGYGDIA